MTYPQPDSEEPVLNGQQSFRLTTELASGGDIYESKVSGLGFAVGPNSDIAEVLVSYFDEDSPSLVSQAVISPDRTLMGRVDARNEVQYPSRRRGRILISPHDIYDTTARPDPFDPATDVIQFEAPILDVIEYFVSPPSVVPPRSDRTFRFQYPPIATDPLAGKSWIVIPAYGRKSGYFTFKNIGDGIVDTKISVLGFKLSISSAPGPVAAVQRQLFTDTIATGGTSAVYNFKSSADGLWDLIMIGLGQGGSNPYNGGPFPITVVLSDDPL